MKTRKVKSSPHFIAATSLSKLLPELFINSPSHNERVNHHIIFPQPGVGGGLRAQRVQFIPLHWFVAKFSENLKMHRCVSALGSFLRPHRSICLWSPTHNDLFNALADQHVKRAFCSTQKAVFVAHFTVLVDPKNVFSVKERTGKC